MKSRFTGGQYSLLRTVLGIQVALQFAWNAINAEAPLGSAVTIELTVAAVASLLVAAGMWDRIAAIVCAVLTVLIPTQLGVVVGYGPALFCVLLLLHAQTPPAPYGSFAARERTDPRGDWHMPARVRRLQWILLSVAYAYVGLLNFDSSEPVSSWLVSIALIAFGPLSLVPWIRPRLWLIFLIGNLVAALGAFEVPEYGSWLLLHLFAFDPGWIKPMQRGEPTLVFYDGTCGLCHRAIRFFLAEDYCQNLRFAPLQGETIKATLGDRDPKSLPDSLIVFTQDGEMLARSAAVLEAMKRLGGIWRVIASVCGFAPRFILDEQYKTVASARQQFFAKPKQLCPILPPDLAERFLP